MPEYIYKAVDRNGIMVKSRITEKSKQNLVKRLKANDMTPIDIIQTSFGKSQRASRNKISNSDELMKIANSANIAKANTRKLTPQERLNMLLSLQQKITNRDLVIFTQSFYLLKRAGFNNVHALSTLVESTENSTLRGILEDIQAGVESGNYMYTTMEYYSDIFPYIYINLIKVGELSGSLEESLKQAVEYLESSHALTKKIKSILIPNIAQFIFLFILLILGTVIIVPIIQDVFTKIGSKEELPAITLAFSEFLNSLQNVWYIPVLILAVIITALILYIKTPKGRYNWDYFKYKMPIFGKLIFDIDFSRLCKAMVLNLRNGMRIQESLEVSKSVVKNYVMLSVIESSINNIIAGESWVKPFEESGLASIMVVEMLKIGMQTDLSTMMEKLIDFMEMDIDVVLQRIIKVLPQIMYSLVGVLLIFITVVVLVPCIQVYMGTFLFSAVLGE